MKQVKLSQVVCLFLFIVAFFWVVMTLRTLGALLLVPVFAAYFYGKRTGFWRGFCITYILFLICSVLPFDLSFKIIPGKPRFVPLLMGLPTKYASDKARQGEAVLGGCGTTGFEPKWVWVW